MAKLTKNAKALAAKLGDNQKLYGVDEAIQLLHSQGASLALDAKGSLAITDKQGATVTLDADNNRIRVEDANGNVLQDGDSVTVIKDLKVKGSSSVVKVGTKVKNIRLVDGDHDIDCKIDGFGAMQLKSEFVKKA